MAYGFNSFPSYPAPPTYLPPNGYQPGYPAQAYAPRQEAPQPLPPQAAQASGGISARLVTGREEAVAAQVLPDGNIWIFADFAHGTIYTKQVNPQTLAADFHEFRIQDPAPAAAAASAPVPQYVTLDDFRALQDDVERLKAAQPATAKARGGEAK